MGRKRGVLTMLGFWLSSFRESIELPVGIIKKGVTMSVRPQ